MHVRPYIFVGAGGHQKVRAAPARAYLVVKEGKLATYWFWHKFCAGGKELSKLR